RTTPQARWAVAVANSRLRGAQHVWGRRCPPGGRRRSRKEEGSLLRRRTSLRGLVDLVQRLALLGHDGLLDGLAVVRRHPEVDAEAPARALGDKELGAHVEHGLQGLPVDVADDPHGGLTELIQDGDWVAVVIEDRDPL